MRNAIWYFELEFRWPTGCINQWMGLFSIKYWKNDLKVFLQEYLLKKINPFKTYFLYIRMENFFFNLVLNI